MAKLGLDATGFHQNLKGAEHATEKFSHAVQHGVTHALTHAFGARAILRWTHHAIESALAVNKIAKEFKVSTDEAQKLQIVAKDLEMSVGEVFSQYVNGGERFSEIMREMATVKSDSLIDERDIQNLVKYAHEYELLLLKAKKALVKTVGGAAAQADYTQEGLKLEWEFIKQYFTDGSKTDSQLYAELDAKRKEAKNKAFGYGKSVLSEGKGPLWRQGPEALPEIQTAGQILGDFIERNMPLAAFSKAPAVNEQAAERAAAADRFSPWSDSLANVGGFVGGAGTGGSSLAKESNGYLRDIQTNTKKLAEVSGQTFF